MLGLVCLLGFETGPRVAMADLKLDEVGWKGRIALKLLIISNKVWQRLALSSPNHHTTHI